MTELSSHQLTSSIGSTPSIFEILAVESLTTSLREAFRHLSKVIAENFPTHWRVLYWYFDELYVVTDVVLQFIHFRMHGASFPERFYGLRRIPDTREPLVSNRKVLLMVCLQIVFPYIKSKLENLFKAIKESELNGSLNRFKDFVKRIAVIYRITYPWLHFVWETLILCYFMTYAARKTEYPSPLFHLISTKLINSNDENVLPSTWDEMVLKEQNVIFKTVWKMAKFVVGSITLSISAGAVVVQFLDWWYSREGGATMLQSMPIPPSPTKWPVQFSPHICPICLKRRTNDTALSCSGFVFCYPCIFQHLQMKRYCPVTGYPASVNQLIKIYHQDAL